MLQPIFFFCIVVCRRFRVLNETNVILYCLVANIIQCHGMLRTTFIDWWKIGEWLKYDENIREISNWCVCMCGSTLNPLLFFPLSVFCKSCKSHIFAFHAVYFMGFVWMCRNFVAMYTRSTSRSFCVRVNCLGCAEPAYGKWRAYERWHLTAFSKQQSRLSNQNNVSLI